MIGIVIVTHNGLAQEMAAAVQLIVGAQEQMRTVGIGPDDDVESRKREIAEAIRAVDAGRGVVLVTDMFGGTPCNLALTFLKRGKVDVLAGASLPSLIKLVSVRAKSSLDEAVRLAIESGRKYMRAGSAELPEGK
jgi:PTS system mannose-specific IIA component